MSRPAVTVVVPCRDRPQLLDRCLAALARQVGPDDEVIVVDSASTTSDVAAVARRHGVRLLRCDQGGASRARNAGWRSAIHPVVAFVDDDVLVDDRWVEEITAPLAGAGTGFVVGPYRLPEDAVPDGPSATLTTVEPPPVITAPARGVFGAGNLALPRSVLDRVGGFDERLGPGRRLPAGEDMEMLDRVLDLGLVGRYAPAAVGRHVRWRSEADSVRLQWAYGLGMGGRAAAAFRRRPSAGVAMVGDMLRLRGLVTAARRLVPSRRPAVPGGAASPGPPDVSGWLGPALWRLGAITGFVVGLVRLHPRPAGP